MTREEKLYEAAEKFSDDYKYNEDVDYMSIRVAFREGAEWADSHPVNVWHDISEEPEKQEFILVEVINTIPKKNEVRYFVEYVEEWIVGLMKTEGLQCRWAYINDLLPKGGEK